MLPEVFETYGRMYDALLARIYPSKNSTGFTERNLTVNFSKAYEKVSESKNHDAFTWFEFSFGEKDNCHIDAVIVNNTLKEMYVIEAKRYNELPEKIKAVGEDIERIYKFVDELRKETDDAKGDPYKIRIDMNEIEKCYGIILADVWYEEQPKRDLLATYVKKEFLNTYGKKLDINKDIIEDLREVQYFVNSMEYCERERVHPYNLVSLCWEVKKKDCK